jgi:RecA/RadA recombinase
VDTGSYIFNALVSGSIFGGVSGNKITAIAGETSTGKTFFSLAVVKNFLDNNPTGYCLYFDTEAAITKSLLESRGIDTTRLVVVNVVTVEEFRTKTLKAVDIYLKKKEDERNPCIFVLDSLGMLSTNKEINDALAEKDTRDMTKAQLIKGAFRMLTLKLGQAKIPMLVTNHTYESMSLYGGKQMSGGCLSPGTKIFTRGGYKNIEEITEDDFVYTKEGEFMKVLETHNFKDKELLQIEFDDGYKVTCTPEHKFFIGDEWVEAKDLVVDNEVCCI